jgi:hypothetical protein
VIGRQDWQTDFMNDPPGRGPINSARGPRACHSCCTGNGRFDPSIAVPLEMIDAHGPTLLVLPEHDCYFRLSLLVLSCKSRRCSSNAKAHVVKMGQRARPDRG